ncbi:MAG TPA: reverse transcriptase family protein [Polyangiaceae bacterium]|nr:reverse transcriptase family protein [Polyangiaceae bacterium]
MIPADFSEGLASALLDGAWSSSELESRARVALGSRPRWLRPLCARVLASFPEPPAETRSLALHLEQDARLAAALKRAGRMPRIRRWFLPEPRMAARPVALASIALPPIDRLGTLADMLSLSPAQLAWFADVRGLNAARASEQLSHYHYRWVAKRSGGYRLLETPKLRIKRMQRWLLRELLSHVPPEPSAHGFVPRRSVLSFVADHVGKAVVLRLDLEDFFATIAVARVHALFARLGYPHTVAQTLAGLCCVATPEAILRANPEPDPSERHRAAQRLRIPHLPQGAPTSPALSNLVAWRLDRRLSGLARALGLSYSRYADDLAFSGERTLLRRSTRFVVRAGAIALEEGFRLRYRKLRVMPHTGRQHLAGLIINARPNVPRRDYDALRATLHNAIQHGPDSQNRTGHPDFRAQLEGRITWIAQTNQLRATRLRTLFDRIHWP